MKNIDKKIRLANSYLKEFKYKQVFKNVVWHNKQGEIECTKILIRYGELTFW